MTTFDYTVFSKPTSKTTTTEDVKKMVDSLSK